MSNVDQVLSIWLLPTPNTILSGLHVSKKEPCLAVSSERASSQSGIQSFFSFLARTFAFTPIMDARHVRLAGLLGTYVRTYVAVSFHFLLALARLKITDNGLRLPLLL